MHCLHKTKNVRHNIFSNIWLKNKVRPLEDYIYCMDLLLLVSCMHYAQKEMKQPVILTELASICKCFWDCKNFFVQSKKKYTNLGVHGRKGEMDKIQSKFFLSCVGDLSKNEVVTTHSAVTAAQIVVQMYIRIKWGPNVWNSRHPNSIKRELTAVLRAFCTTLRWHKWIFWGFEAIFLKVYTLQSRQSR